MSKKISASFQPARLVLARWRTHISLYALNKKGIRKWYRPSFSLNRIHNLNEREQRGRDLVKRINWWLDQGLYFEDFDERKVIIEIKKAEGALERTKINLIEAIIDIRDEKVASTDRRSSKRSHLSHANIFIKFLKGRGWEKLAVDEFSKVMAKDYAKYWYTNLGCKSNTTYNTKRVYINMYFKYFKDMEYIEKNPFSILKPKRRVKAKKTNYTIEQMPILAKELKENNIWIWAAVQLAFWGLIRQEELARLRFHMFNVQEWVLDLTQDETKNHKDDIITLPVFLRKAFLEIGFFDQPSNYYLIGNDMRPGIVMIDEKKLNKTHQRIFSRLAKKQMIEKLPGQSFSSWRRTGMDYFSRRLIPRLFKDHNRHDSFETTERYLPNRKIIDQISTMNNDVFI